MAEIMKKTENSLNTIYIPERLQKLLSSISRYPMTVITAPMGYGKSTAVNWYLSQCMKTESAVSVRINVYSDNLSVFWKGIRNSFSRLGITLLNEYDCPTDTASAEFIADDFIHSFQSDLPCYIFIDDFHLLKNKHIANFFGCLAKRLPENIHLILASRDRIFSDASLLLLGRNLYQINVDQLRLNRSEIGIYARRCGIMLNESSLEILSDSSEGWFSAVYLNLCVYLKEGEFANHRSDIYRMFAAAMILPLPEMQQEFLTVMGLADEFTDDMAREITRNPDTESILRILTEQNAFVKRLSDNRYRFHHMMKECAQQTFSTLDTKKQQIYLNRYGTWYEKHHMYLHALSAYRKSTDYDGVLRIIQKDAGILLSSLNPSAILELIEQCPVSFLKNHPLSVLVLMRSMFNWKKIPEMLKLKDLLMQGISEHPEITQNERENLLGECDLIMSFLMYNDIEQMSHFHRSAATRMSRPAISIQNKGGWTFGSPSVLLMFHREPGKLNRELNKMEDCMPYYYKVTNGHGYGAEHMMAAEAEFIKGHFVDAQIKLEEAWEKIAEKGQESISLCGDFLSYRLAVCMNTNPETIINQRRRQLIQQHNIMWINIFDSICAYYYALTEEDKIPALFRRHQLSSVNFLAPGKPMMDMIENQVYLAQKEYARVIGRSERLLALCENMHYDMVSLHIRIQTAAAYEHLGKYVNAQRILKKAFVQAQPDNILMPFVENYEYLSCTYKQIAATGKNEFLMQIMELGQKYEEHLSNIRLQKSYPEIFQSLTEREQKIADMIAEHLSNKEIAEKMFLSEGTIKQYINQIYSKLQITGDIRNKRKQLIELFHQ